MRARAAARRRTGRALDLPDGLVDFDDLILDEADDCGVRAPGEVDARERFVVVGDDELAELLGEEALATLGKGSSLVHGYVLLFGPTT